MRTWHVHTFGSSAVVEAFTPERHPASSFGCSCPLTTSVGKFAMGGTFRRAFVARMYVVEGPATL